MQNLKLTLGMSLFIMIFAAGCSIFGGKKDVAAETPKVPDTNLTTHNVYDAGIYREKESYSDLQEHGGKMGDTIPSEKFYSVDRDKYAPIGKVMYVLTDEDPQRCIPGKYTMLDGKKKLIVYSKTTVPTNYCIYQKTFGSEPEGFSLYMHDGGMCKPSYAVTKVDDQKRTVSSVEEVSKIVSMKYCVENTVSYGEMLNSGKSVASSSEAPKKHKKHHKDEEEQQ